MSIVLDVILVVIFAAFVLTAAKKGFVKTLLELVAVVKCRCGGLCLD